jgi:hypothetical protein
MNDSIAAEARETVPEAGGNFSPRKIKVLYAETGFSFFKNACIPQVFDPLIRTTS